MRKFLAVIVFCVIFPTCAFAQSVNQQIAKRVWKCSLGKIACSGPKEKSPMGQNGWIFRDVEKGRMLVVHACEKNCQFGQPELRIDLLDETQSNLPAIDWLVIQMPATIIRLAKPHTSGLNAPDRSDRNFRLHKYLTTLEDRMFPEVVN